MSDKPHTKKQRASLHVLCELIAQVLNDSGLSRQVVIDYLRREGIEADWSKESVKELIWKPVQLALLDMESTEENTTTSYDITYNHIARHFAGVHGVELPPFPDRFTQAEEHSQIDSLGMERVINAIRGADTLEDLKNVGRITVPRFLEAHDNDEKLRQRLTGIYLDRLAELEVAADNEGEQ